MATVELTRPGFARWYLAAVLVTMGVFAIGLGVPRLMAGIAAGPQDETLRELAAGRPVPPILLKRTVDSRKKALEWVASGRSYSDLATLRMFAVAGTRPLSSERRMLVLDAIETQRAALALAPADAYGWNRLLQAMAVAARPVAEVERVMDMSLRGAPSEPGVVMARLQAGLLYWQGFSASTRERLNRQIRLAALWMPSDLARLARARFADATVASALVDDPRLVARYNYVRMRI